MMVWALSMARSAAVTSMILPDASVIQPSPASSKVIAGVVVIGNTAASNANETGEAVTVPVPVNCADGILMRGFMAEQPSSHRLPAGSLTMCWHEPLLGRLTTSAGGSEMPPEPL